MTGVGQIASGIPSDGLGGTAQLDRVAADNRSRERYRRIALTAAAGVGARGVSFATVLVSVPLAARYLGAERYGVYATIASFSALLGFADLGLGNGLTNAVSDALGRNDRRAARLAISSTLAVLIGVAVLLLVGVGAAYALLPWAHVFGVHSPLAAREVGPAAAVFGVCFALTVPLGLVQRAQLGCQEAFFGHFALAVGNLLALAGVGCAVYLHAGLPWLVLALSGAPIVAAAANGVVFFGRRHPDLRPVLRTASVATARQVLRVGALFLMLQVAMAVAYQSDAIVLAQVRGSASVSEYAIPMRLFMFIPLVIGLVVSPLWPAYTEALARGDIAWTRRTLNRSVALVVAVACPLSLLLGLAAPTLVTAWVGDVVRPGPDLLLALAFWAVVMTLSNAYAMFLNGAGILRPQVIASSVMMVANLGASIELAKHLGAAGVVWGTVGTQVCFFVVPATVYMRRWLALTKEAT